MVPVDSPNSFDVLLGEIALDQCADTIDLVSGRSVALLGNRQAEMSLVRWLIITLKGATILLIAFNVLSSPERTLISCKKQNAGQLCRSNHVRSGAKLDLLERLLEACLVKRSSSLV